MRLSLIIAWRYLVGKKSTNAINIITGLSILGIAVGSAALILVLSVFNGFEGLLANLMNTVNADVKVELKRGKTFHVDSAQYQALAQVDGVASISYVLEETALVEYAGSQDFCTLKGVDDNYNRTTTIDSAIYQGQYLLRDANFDYLIMGGGIASRLNVNMRNMFEPVSVYMARRRVRSPVDQPFKKLIAYPSAKFSIKQDYDYQYIFCSIEFSRQLLERPGEASAIELSFENDADQDAVVRAIGVVMGDQYTVKDRYAQNDALFKLMQMEKWLSYAIAGLTLLIVSFNLVGALWMIVLDKQHDLSILKAMGATAKQIRDLILSEGLLVTLLGTFLGMSIAVLLYLLHRQFVLISFPEGFVVEAYPLALRLRDFAVVFVTVLTIGLLASILPARRGASISPYVRED